MKTVFLARDAGVALIAGALLLPGSCETVRPRVQAVGDVPSAGKFPHARFSLLLEKVVSPDGLVDYAQVSLEQTLLEEYLAEVARVSPDSHPHLFPTEEDRIVYWINAHNACAIRGVLRWNRPPSLDKLAHRFDAETLFIVGGKELSLNGITNGIMRKRFPEPRVHFVLVKARRGGPPLAKTAYEPNDLDERMEAAAKAYLADERNVDWIPPSTRVRLSRILIDFRADFERQVPTTVSGDKRLILALNRWRSPKDKIQATEIAPIPFDERLNDVANK